MKRWQALVLPALAVAAGATAATANCTDGEVRLRFHHTAAESGNARAEAATTLAQRINTELNGRACMEVVSRAEDHTEATLTQALNEGRFEITAAATGALGAVSKRFLVFDLPFLFDDVPSVLAFQASTTGRELLVDALPAGIRGLGFILDGFDQIAANREVVAPKDLEGARYRVGGSELDSATAASVDAVPVVLAEQGLADAMKAGDIDALDGSWSTLRSNGTARAAAGMTETNHTVQQYMLVTASGFWDGLDPALRADLEQIILETAHERNRLAFELNEAAKYAMLEGGVRIRRLTDAERLEWKRAMQNVWFGFGGNIGFDQISTALYANSTAGQSVH